MLKLRFEARLVSIHGKVKVDPFARTKIAEVLKIFPHNRFGGSSATPILNRGHHPPGTNSSLGYTTTGIGTGPNLTRGSHLSPIIIA
jgi:hypothetical protein